MVSVLEPELLEPLLLLLLSLLSLPQAATPNASAAMRQLEAATERTRKGSLLRDATPEVARSYPRGRTRSNAAAVVPRLSRRWTAVRATGRDCPAGTARRSGRSRRPAG